MLKEKRRQPKQKRKKERGLNSKEERCAEAEREGWNREFFSIYFLSNVLRKNYGELVCVGFNF